MEIFGWKLMGRKQNKRLLTEDLVGEVPCPTTHPPSRLVGGGAESFLL
jgi:hypothetical protein